jgi:hypothetical protein
VLRAAAPPAISDHSLAYLPSVLRPSHVPTPAFLNQSLDDGWGLDVDQVQHSDAKVHAGGADVVLGEGGFDLALVDWWPVLEASIHARWTMGRGFFMRRSLIQSLPAVGGRLQGNWSLGVKGTRDYTDLESELEVVKPP